MKTDGSSRLRSLLITAGLAVAILIVVVQWRSLCVARAGYAALREKATQIKQDAAYIHKMQSAPRLAVDRERPNGALLAQIQEGVEAADLPLSDWIANEPHPPVRIPKSPYKRIGHTIVLQNTSLRQIALLLHHVTTEDPSLVVKQLRLTSGTTAKERWNATLGLAYHIYAPAH